MRPAKARRPPALGHLQRARRTPEGRRAAALPSVATRAPQRRGEGPALRRGGLTALRACAQSQKTERPSWPPANRSHSGPRGCPLRYARSVNHGPGIHAGRSPRSASLPPGPAHPPTRLRSTAQPAWPVRSSPHPCGSSAPGTAPPNAPPAPSRASPPPGWCVVPRGQKSRPRAPLLWHGGAFLRIMSLCIISSSSWRRTAPTVP